MENEMGRRPADIAVDEMMKAEKERQRQEEIAKEEKKIGGLNPEADISRGETEKAFEDIDDVIAEKETKEAMKGIMETLEE